MVGVLVRLVPRACGRSGRGGIIRRWLTTPYDVRFRESRSRWRRRWGAWFGVSWSVPG